MEFHKREIARCRKRKYRAIKKEYNTDYKEVMALMHTHRNEAKEHLQSMLFLLYN